MHLTLCRVPNLLAFKYKDGQNRYVIMIKVNHTRLARIFTTPTTYISAHTLYTR